MEKDESIPNPFDITQASLARGPLQIPGTLSKPIWRELHCFLSVAKHGSFSRAAEELGVSQPTIARAVERLNDVVKTKLLTVTNQGVQLTTAGQRLARKVADIDMAIHSIASDFSTSAALEGRVRISITEGLAGFFAAPNLPEFSSYYPGISIELGNPTSLLNLKDNLTDVMVGFIAQNTPDITCQRLGYLHFVPIASQAYIERAGIPTRSNLSNHIVINSEFYSSKSGVWDRWHDLCRLGRMNYLSDSMFTYGMMVKCGLGIGLLGSYACIEPAAVPLELGVHVRVPIYALSMSKKLEDPAVKVTFDWLCSLFSEDNPWFSADLNMNIPHGKYDEGFRKLFNI